MAQGCYLQPRLYCTYQISPLASWENAPHRRNGWSEFLPGPPKNVQEMDQLEADVQMVTETRIEVFFAL